MIYPIIQQDLSFYHNIEDFRIRLFQNDKCPGIFGMSWPGIPCMSSQVTLGPVCLGLAESSMIAALTISYPLLPGHRVFHLSYAIASETADDADSERQAFDPRDTTAQAISSSIHNVFVSDSGHSLIINNIHALIVISMSGVRPYDPEAAINHTPTLYAFRRCFDETCLDDADRAITCMWQRSESQVKVTEPNDPLNDVGYTSSIKVFVQCAVCCPDMSHACMQHSQRHMPTNLILKRHCIISSNVTTVAKTNKAGSY